MEFQQVIQICLMWFMVSVLLNTIILAVDSINDDTNLIYESIIKKYKRYVNNYKHSNLRLYIYFTVSALKLLLISIIQILLLAPLLPFAAVSYIIKITIENKNIRKICRKIFYKNWHKGKKWKNRFIKGDKVILPDGRVKEVIESNNWEIYDEEKSD